MEFKIKIFMSAGCVLNEEILGGIRYLRNGNSYKITTVENIGTLDLKQIISAICDGFDGIYIIISGKIKKGKPVSKYDSFLKIVEESNRLLARRGFGEHRVDFCYWIGRKTQKLIKDIRNFYKNIKILGLNPLNYEKNEIYENVH
ncbi:MAG: hydrogenase iron-sulfur subunit [Candidatus Lokiarchaeota archaeon]|nr:hydrogenase iron-sulfur subunit [Candidatus Lokiarchaeota archaeon]